MNEKKTGASCLYLWNVEDCPYAALAYILIFYGLGPVMVHGSLSPSPSPFLALAMRENPERKGGRAGVLGGARMAGEL